GRALARVTDFRATPRGADWLFFRGGSTATISIYASLPDGPVKTTTTLARVANNTTISRPGLIPARLDNTVGWIAPSGQGTRELHEVYSDATRRSGRLVVNDLLARVIPGLVDLGILTEDSRPVLYANFQDHSLPVAVLGEGVKALIKLALELAARAKGTALV